MKYTKPFSEFEKFAVVDVVTTSSGLDDSKGEETEA